MAIKTQAEIEVIEETLQKLMLSVSFFKATGKSFTSDWIAFPADETELQLDYMIQLIQNLNRELKEVD